MHRPIAAFWIAALLAGTAAGDQSLGEIARKERERRAGLRQEERSPTIGEKELAAARGESLSISGEEASRSEPAAEPEPAKKELSAKEVRDLRAAWSRIWEGQMEQARDELDHARNNVDQCRAAAHFVYVPIAVDCDGVDLRLALAEARLKEVAGNRYRWELLLPGNDAVSR